MNEEAMSKKIATYENDILKHQEDKKRNDERITQLEKQEKKYVEEIKILEKELQEFKSGNNVRINFYFYILLILYRRICTKIK